MTEKTPEQLRDECHGHGEEAMRLFKEAESLQKESKRINDLTERGKVMHLAHAKDLEAIEHLRKSNKASLELARYIRSQNLDLLKDA